MIEDCLKLVAYFGESDRVGGRLLSDVLLALLEREQPTAAVLLRAAEGFGIKQRLHTQRLLTLSEDLPLVVTAVDTRERIEALLPLVRPLVPGGLVTLERARLARGATDGELAADLRGAAKLTIYLGRHDRADGRPAYVAAVDLLRAHGFAGATVLLGVDGFVHGRRARGRFLSRNADVPLMVVAVGPDVAVASVLEPLTRLLERPLLTLERVTICKRDGETLAGLPRPDETDADGVPVWQKVAVHAPEDAQHGRHSLYLQLIRGLREHGASGATALRGIWGFSGNREPHGDRFTTIRRGVPVVTLVVDRPAAMQRLWDVIDPVTRETGLVTCELVPAARPVAPGDAPGGAFTLARPR